MPGTNFRIVKELGQDASRQAYQVEHTDGRLHSMSRLRKGIEWTDEVTRAYVADARVASRIHSPYVIDLVHVTRPEDGRVIMVTGTVPENSLARELKRGQITLERAVGIMRQLCKALSSMHSAGVIHGGLTPEVVRLTERDGREDGVVLLEFGVHHLWDAKGVELDRVHALYLSPEQTRKKRVCTPQSDIYALGCVAYHILAGKHPFDAPTVEDIIENIKNGEPPAINGIPAGIDAVIQRCLAQRADDRFKSADDLELAIIRAQKSAGFATPWDALPAPQTRSQQPAKKPKKPKREPTPAWRRFATGLVAIGMFAGGVVVISGGAAAPDPSPDADGKAATKKPTKVATAPKQPVPSKAEADPEPTKVVEPPEAPPETPPDTKEPEAKAIEEPPPVEPDPVDPSGGPPEEAPAEQAPPEEAPPEVEKEPKPAATAPVRDPAAAKALAAKGKTAMNQGRRSEAKKLFQRALRADNRNAAALIGMSDLYFDQGNYRKAVTYGRRAVGASGRADYRVRLGDAYLKLQRYKDARTQYERAAKSGHAGAKKRVKKLDKMGK